MPISWPALATAFMSSGKVSIEWPGINQVVLIPKRSNKFKSLGAPTSPENMAAHLDVLSVAKNLERIADHATNIAEDVIYLQTGSIIRHQPKSK